MSAPIEVQMHPEAVTKPLLPAAILDRFKGCRYASSPSGVDSNLLILLHGLGDSSEPFFKLAQTLQNTLPQTAVLSLQASYLIPYLDGNHWMWWPTFDQFAEVLTAPNPTKTTDDMVTLLDHLTSPILNSVGSSNKGSGCGWDPRNIHLFGFGQGASCALEMMVKWSKTRANAAGPLGSVVSVCGDFVSHPTLDTLSSTPIFHIYRASKALESKFGSFRKATKHFTQHRLALAPGGVDEAMPRNKDEWDPIMQFWSRLFRHRSTWEIKGEAVRMG